MGLSIFQAANPDLGFHLATGRAVRDLGAIPATNVLSFTQPDYPWMSQQWLPAVAFSLVWEAAGIRGLILLKAVLVLGIWALVWRTARVLGARPLSAALGTLLAASGCAFRFVERPYLFSDLLLAGVGWALARWWTKVPEARGRHGFRDAHLLAAGGFTLVACHLHAGAVYLFLLLAAAAAGAVLEPIVRQRWLQRTGPSGLRDGGRLLGIAFGAFGGAAVTLALYHPHGIRVLWVPIAMGIDPYAAQHLVEFRPPWAFPLSVVGPYWILVLAVVLGTGTRLRGVHVASWLAVGGFLALSLRHVRIAFEFAIVSGPVVALSVEALRLRFGRRASIVTTALAATFGCLAIAAPVHQWSRHPFGLGYDERVWPITMFRFIEQGGLNGRAYVSDGWAGPYLAWFYPQRRAFFDPRLDAYSPEFVRNVYQHIRYGRTGWDVMLDQYGVELVLLKYTTPKERSFQQGRANLRQHLARDPQWVLAGFDDRGELFVRAGRLPPDETIVGIDPDLGTFLGRPAASAASLLRFLQSSRLPSARGSILTAWALQDAGDPARASAILEDARRRYPDDPNFATGPLARGSGAAPSGPTTR